MVTSILRAAARAAAVRPCAVHLRAAAVPGALGKHLQAQPTRHAQGWVDNVIDTIGMTPMVRLNKCLPDDVVAENVLVKLEMQNPGGSVKDRIALSMITEAEKRGDIDPSRTTIVEATSGNTGIGLAMVAAAKGYKCIIVMPQVPSMYERYIICRKFGAEVHLTSVCEAKFSQTIQNLMGYADDLCANNADYWQPTQFRSHDNPLAHTSGTGPEIWEQTGGAVDAFIAGAGTGGTINGVSRYLKGLNPDCHTVCVEPTESRVLVGEDPDMHGVVGIGAGLQLPLLEDLAPGQPFVDGARGTIDEFLHASTPEAVQWANKVAAEEGLLIGPSSGAAIKVAVDVAKRAEMAGKNIVVIQASSAIRYVSHPMWEGVRVEGQAALPIPPDLENEFPICRWTSEAYVPPAKE